MAKTCLIRTATATPKHTTSTPRNTTYNTTHAHTAHATLVNRPLPRLPHL